MKAWVYVESDSEHNKFYKVVYDSETDRTTCECPAYIFGQSKTCKHIARVANDLIGEVEENMKAQDESPEASDGEQGQLLVSFNDSPFKALSWESIEWLVENMGPEQVVSIKKG